MSQRKVLFCEENDEEDKCNLMMMYYTELYCIAERDVYNKCAIL